MPLTRWTKTLLTLLAALLAVPTFLLSPAGAAATQPGEPPTRCVNDVERQFDSLKHHPEALGFHLGGGAYDPTSGRHYQGIVRLPGTGTPTFLVSRNGNPAPQETTGDSQPGELNVVQLGSRDDSGERVRSSRIQANTDVYDTPVPSADRVVKSLKFEGTHAPGGRPAYRHIGSMQMWGDVAIIGMDKPFREPAIQPPGTILMVNFSDPENPYTVGEFPMQHPAGSIGVAEFEPGRLLVVTTGSGGSPVYGYEVRRNGGPTTELSGSFGLAPLFEYDAANADIGWPTGSQSLQTINLFRDCATGELYLMGGYNLTPLENTSRDRIGVWKLNPTGEPRMTRVSKREVWCEFEFTTRACNMAAASGFHVTPSGDLLLYATTHENDGPDGTVEMAEFASRDGYDQDGAYRPTAVPGTYNAAVNAPITLDGTASLPALAQARVELYDDVHFRDRSVVIDYPDRAKEDYRHLGRVEGFNDKTSSVRWRLPSSCEAVLFDDKDHRGRQYSLPGADGSAQAVNNLRSFGDKATSVEFYGPLRRPDRLLVVGPRRRRHRRRQRCHPDDHPHLARRPPAVADRVQRLRRLPRGGGLARRLRRNPAQDDGRGERDARHQRLAPERGQRRAQRHRRPNPDRDPLVDHRRRPDGRAGSARHQGHRARGRPGRDRRPLPGRQRLRPRGHADAHREGRHRGAGAPFGHRSPGAGT